MEEITYQQAARNASAGGFIGFVVGFVIAGLVLLIYNQVDHMMNPPAETPRMSYAELRGECTGSTPNPPYTGGCTWAGQPDLR